MDAVEFAVGTRQSAVERLAMEPVAVAGFLDTSRKRELLHTIKNRTQRRSARRLLLGAFWSQIYIDAVFEKSEKEETEEIYLTWVLCLSIRHFAIWNMFLLSPNPRIKVVQISRRCSMIWMKRRRSVSMTASE